MKLRDDYEIKATGVGDGLDLGNEKGRGPKDGTQFLVPHHTDRGDGHDTGDTERVFSMLIQKDDFSKITYY